MTNNSTDLYHSDDEATPISIMTDPFLEFPSFDPLHLMQSMLKGFCLPTEGEAIPRCIRVAEPASSGLRKTVSPISSVPSTDDEEEEEDEDWLVGAIVPGTPRLVRIGKGLETFICSALLFGMTLYLLQRYGQSGASFWEWHYKTSSTTWSTTVVPHHPSVAWTFK
jgi:hypothetical protein